MTAQATFGFDHASKLAQISLPDKDGQAAVPAAAEPRRDAVRESAGHRRRQDDPRHHPVENPAADAQAPGGAPDAGMMKQIEGMFKGLRVAFKITAPFEIVEHNAHRKTATRWSGNTTWRRCRSSRPIS